jgi:hypothetical protein
LCSRWAKQYRIFCPPPTPKRTPDEAKDTKEAKRQGQVALYAEQIAVQMGVMSRFHEYYLMFHHLLASMCSADGANSMNAKGESYWTYLLGLGNTGDSLVHITS